MVEQVKTVRTETYSLPAGVWKDIAIPGASSFYIVAATDPVTVILNQSGEEATFGSKQGIETDIVRLDVKSATTQFITVAFGFGGARFIDASVAVDMGEVTIDAGAVGSHATPRADVVMNATAVTTLVTANASRKKLILSAHPDNTENIRIGETGVGASAGLILSPGLTIDLDVTCSMAGVNEASATGQIVSVLEIT